MSLKHEIYAGVTAAENMLKAETPDGEDALRFLLSAQGGTAWPLLIDDRSVVADAPDCKLFSTVVALLDEASRDLSMARFALETARSYADAMED